MFSGEMRHRQSLKWACRPLRGRSGSIAGMVMLNKSGRQYLQNRTFIEGTNLTETGKGRPA